MKNIKKINKICCSQLWDLLITIMKILKIILKISFFWIYLPFLLLKGSSTGTAKSSKQSSSNIEPIVKVAAGYTLVEVKNTVGKQWRIKIKDSKGIDSSFFVTPGVNQKYGHKFKWR